MKWFFNKCRRHEADLSLLAAGALAEAERVEVESHLPRCPSCRAKQAELKILVRGLAEAGHHLPQVETPVALHRRWMTAVRQPDAESSVVRGAARPAAGLVAGWLSGRKLAWGSVGAMWALVIFFRFSAPDVPRHEAPAAAPPVTLREVMLALKVENPPGLQADWRKSSQPKPPRPDALPPGSRRPAILASDSKVA